MTHQEALSPRKAARVARTGLRRLSSLAAIATSSGENLFRKRGGAVLSLDPSHKPALLCANGPSLVSDLPLIRRESYGQIVVVNAMASTDYFETLRPTAYFIQDRFWFEREPFHEQKVEQMFRALNDKVSWKMALCIPSRYAKQFRTSQQITNKFIEIRSFDGPELKSGHLGTVNDDFNLRTKFLTYLWNRSFLYPPLEGIASTALFELIRTHPVRIDLAGLDMTMGRDLSVDTSGSLGFFPSHFYGKSADRVPDYGPTISTAHAYFWLSRKFHLFNLLRAYADAQGVTILNRTADTLLDSFPASSLTQEMHNK